MRKNFTLLLTAASLLFISSIASAQGLLNRGIQKLDNALSNTVKNKEEEKKFQNKNVQTHQVGVIQFAAGVPNARNANNVSYVNTIDLSQPYYYNIKLDKPVGEIKNGYEKRGQYDIVVPNIIRTYYLN